MNDAAVEPFSGAAFRERARASLTFDLPDGLLDGRMPPRGGDHIIDGGGPWAPKAAPKTAAVLIPIIDHAPEATILLTQRVDTLRAHSGQIAFPGGRIDPGDATPADAALREAWEEVGLEARHVEPIGYLEPYLTGTGYLVVPTVGIVNPPVRLTLNPSEVRDAFEVPLSFLMEPSNHQRQSRTFGGTLRSFYAMPYAERYIWGITAGILRGLYERLYG